MILLKEAKEQSLKRWKEMLDDYPNIKTHFGGQPDGDVYGSCGFCDMFRTDCIFCPLFPNICKPLITDATLYWRICCKLASANKRGLKQMIQKMIREIEKVEV